MELQGHTVFIPLEYIPLFCVGVVLLFVVGAIYVKIRQALAPHKETVYYDTASFLRQDD
jgi:hypothetical protein